MSRVELDAATLDALLHYLPRVVPKGPSEADELHDLIKSLAGFRGKAAA